MQTWTIDGKTMNLAQLNKWKAEKELEKNGLSEPINEPEPEIKERIIPNKLAEQGYNQPNSTEEAFKVLQTKMKEKKWFGLSAEEQKLYKLYKSQLGI